MSCKEYAVGLRGLINDDNVGDLEWYKGQKVILCRPEHFRANILKFDIFESSQTQVLIYRGKVHAG